MKVKGLKELEKKLKRMEKKDAKKAVRKGVREAQKITQKVAKSNSQSMVGGEMGQKISGALKVKPINKQKKGYYALQVGIDPNKSDEFVHITEDGTRYYIPTAIEYGHRKQGGGTVPAIPFMKKASDETEQQRIKKMVQVIKKEVEKK